jgi:polygalacturonase
VLLSRREICKLAALGLSGASLAPGSFAPGSFATASAAPLLARPLFDIREFGAAGDGKTLDTDAVNNAITAAAAAGGGVVYVPAGSYACHSIRLKSFVVLVLGAGATILAAQSGGFDSAEPNTPWEAYQDFGHNHWHNSLIWGENLQDIGILGPGRIVALTLARDFSPGSELPREDAPGAANKAIALKRCANVTLRDFAIRVSGHFGILATGVENLVLENLKIDANRDGMNIDCCRNVRISGCSVNSPYDDGICLKSSYALGEARPTENVTISDCYVTGGFAPGAMLDGSGRRLIAPDFGEPTGRIKFGTESNGGFRNITVSNCVFESCRGLALECVDGGSVEDLTFSNLVMRDLRNAPFFLRLGARLRAPPGTGVGSLRRVMISHMICDAPGNAMPAIIAGIPGHPVEDISISDVMILQKGGVLTEMAQTRPPEEERDYPEPARFGALPAQGLFVRHARNLECRHLEIKSLVADARAFVWLEDVEGADFSGLRVSPLGGAAVMRLREVRRLQIKASPPLAEGLWNHVARARLP